MISAPVPALHIGVGDATVQIRCSTVADGDFHIDGSRPALMHRRAAFCPGEWTQLDEVHGTVVVPVSSPGEHDLASGDALVTACSGAVLAVWVGDCAPVALVGDLGEIAAAHAGWRGALDGVLQRTVAAMRSTSVTAVLGPCIHPCCYEFGAAGLAEFSQRFGPQVVGTTSWGTPALDMRAVVAAALAEVHVDLRDLSRCTGCDGANYYSHRRRGQLGRQVMTICKRSRR